MTTGSDESLKPKTSRLFSQLKTLEFDFIVLVDGSSH